MMPDKWKSILGNIKDSFEVLEDGVSHIEDEGGVDVEFIEFNGPLGRIRLEYISKPAILDRKMTYSARIGSETKVDYIYSKDERTYILNVHKWDEDKNDWSELDPKMFDN